MRSAVGGLIGERATSLPRPVTRLALAVSVLAGSQVRRLVRVAVRAVRPLPVEPDGPEGASLPVLDSAHDFEVLDVDAPAVDAGRPASAAGAVVASVVDRFPLCEPAPEVDFHDEPMDQLPGALVDRSNTYVALRLGLPLGDEEAASCFLRTVQRTLDDLLDGEAGASCREVRPAPLVRLPAREAVLGPPVLRLPTLGAGVLGHGVLSEKGSAVDGGPRWFRPS